MEELLAAAREATEAAYAPYSGFPVGAAVRTPDGSVYTGCNVENANYANSLHAEAVAVGTAIADGHAAVDALAVSAPKRPGLAPCGTCRQTLWEVADADCPVHCDRGSGAEPRTVRLDALLPDAMGPEDLAVDT